MYVLLQEIICISKMLHLIKFPKVYMKVSIWPHSQQYSIILFLFSFNIWVKNMIPLLFKFTFSSYKWACNFNFTDTVNHKFTFLVNFKCFFLLLHSKVYLICTVTFVIWLYYILQILFPRLSFIFLNLLLLYLILDGSFYLIIDRCTQPKG